jgi:hypothetical protein
MILVRSAVLRRQARIGGDGRAVGVLALSSQGEKGVRGKNRRQLRSVHLKRRGGMGRWWEQV